MKKFLPKFLLVLISAIALSLSLRGNMGNPQESELNNVEWREDGPFELSPERGRFGLTYSLVEHHSPFFSVPLARFITPDLGYINDKYVSLFAPGLSYLIMPGYIVGKYFGASQVGSFAIISLFAIFNLLLLYGIARKLGVGKTASFIAPLVFLFATPAFAYGVDLYQHHVSTFLILSSLYLLFASNHWIALSLVWLLCAASIPLDYPNLILMLPLGLYALSRIVEITRTKESTTINFRFWRILTFISMSLPIAFFLWFNQTSYANPLQFSGTIGSVANIGQDGRPAQLPEYNLDIAKDYVRPADQEKSAVRFFNPRSMVEGLQVLLLSRDRGVITFTPIMLLGIIGAFVLFKQRPKEVALLASVIVANLLLYSMWGDPWGGWAFGARYLIPSYALLSIFVASWLSRYQRNLPLLLLFLLLMGYSVYVSTAGALSSSTNPPQVQVLSLEQLSGRPELYSWDRNIEFLQNGHSKSFAYNTFFKDYLSPLQYFELIAYSLIGIIAVATIVLYFSPKGKV